MKQHLKSGSKSGFIAFITILLISAVILMIAISVSMVSINLMQTSLSFYQGTEAQYLAESCADDALEIIKKNNNYVNNSYNLLSGHCQVEAVKSNDDWIIDISAEKNNYIKKLRIEATRSNNIAINSWLQVE